MTPRFIISNILLALVLLFGSAYVVTAQSVAPLSGDSVCGSSTSTICNLKGDIGKVIRNALAFFIKIAVLFMIVAFMWAGVMLAISQDKAVALKEAKGKLTRVIIGIVLVSMVATIGTYLALLQFAGVNMNILQFIGSLFAFVPGVFVMHAYAQESAALLPNALGVTDLYDFLLLLIRLFVRWFVFPALVFAWLYTGLQFVFAQGNPGKIKEARTWLLWVFIATFIIMLSEAFAFALRATINQIF
jgi:hypothetical protein